jgi:hypothetical protein
MNANRKNALIREIVAKIATIVESDEMTNVMKVHALRELGISAGEIAKLLNSR